MNLLVDDERGFYFQPCFSPVWDTGIITYALGESEMAEPEALEPAADWLISKEVRRKGDWSVKRPTVEAFWMVTSSLRTSSTPILTTPRRSLLGLAHARSANSAKTAGRHRAEPRAGCSPCKAKDGGWAAFDVDNNWEFLSAVPFADHNAMLDPTCPDITGRVIEALIAHGVKPNHPAIARGLEYLRDSQEADGSWYGRWGVDYIYGTFLALRGF